MLLSLNPIELHMFQTLSVMSIRFICIEHQNILQEVWYQIVFTLVIDKSSVCTFAEVSSSQTDIRANLAIEEIIHVGRSRLSHRPSRAPRAGTAASTLSVLGSRARARVGSSQTPRPHGEHPHPVEAQLQAHLKTLLCFHSAATS
jgi:hypothetical protein